jgi:hypothetical protein
MTRMHPVAAAARGAAFHLTFTALSLSALTAWARFCAAHKHRS